MILMVQLNAGLGVIYPFEVSTKVVSSSATSGKIAVK